MAEARGFSAHLESFVKCPLAKLLLLMDQNTCLDEVLLCNLEHGFDLEKVLEQEIQAETNGGTSLI